MANFTQFGKEVNLSSREDMINFLKNHARYYLANSWNQITSYANNIKIHNLNIDSEIKDAFYDMLDTDATDMAYDVLSDFRDRYNGNYQIASNGRSGGYLVLYHGYKKNPNINLTAQIVDSIILNRQQKMIVVADVAVRMPVVILTSLYMNMEYHSNPLATMILKN